MITKIFTPKENLIVTTSTPLYKLVAIILIVNKFNAISVSKLQVYMWGLQNKENQKKLKIWKEQDRVTEVPWVLEDDIMPIISQCIDNHFLKLETNKSKKVVVSLGLNANHFLQEIEKLELVNELNNSLTYIGKLTDKMLENIEFDF